MLTGRRKLADSCRAMVVESSRTTSIEDALYSLGHCGKGEVKRTILNSRTNQIAPGLHPINIATAYAQAFERDKHQLWPRLIGAGRIDFDFRRLRTRVAVTDRSAPHCSSVSTWLSGGQSLSQHPAACALVDNNEVSVFSLTRVNWRKTRKLGKK